MFASVLAMLYVRHAAVACPQQSKTMSFAHNRAVYLPPRVQPQTLGGSCFFRRQLHLNNWHISGLLINGFIWSTPSETLGNKTYHPSCRSLMSSARFAKVTWLNKNIQFISGPLKLIERAVKKSSGPLWVFIMLVKLCYPTGNARVSDNNTEIQI